MPLIYALVARQQFVIADYSVCQGNFPEVALNVLGKLGQPKTFHKFETSAYKFELYSKNGFEFLVMSDKEYPSRISFSYLAKLQKEFEEKFTADIRSQLMEHPQEMPQFTPIIQEWTVRYNDPKQVDKLQKLKQELFDLEKQAIDKINQGIETSRTEEELQKWTQAKEKATSFKKHE